MLTVEVLLANPTEKLHTARIFDICDNMVRQKTVEFQERHSLEVPRTGIEGSRGLDGCSLTWCWHLCGHRGLKGLSPQKTQSMTFFPLSQDLAIVKERDE